MRVYTTILLTFFHLHTILQLELSFALEFNSDHQIFFHGDSILRYQYDMLDKTAVINEYMTLPIKFTADKYAESLNQSNIDTVYLNFGVSHALHLYPHRIFGTIYSSNDKFKVADITTAIYLETWMKYDLTYFIHTFKNVIVMLPHRICRELSRHHLDWFGNENKEIDDCMYAVNTFNFTQVDKLLPKHWVINKSKLYYGNLKIEENRRTFCEETVFANIGSEAMARRMLNVLKEFPTVKVIDGYSLTKCLGCKFAQDIIHYKPCVVRIEARIFKELLCKMDSSKCRNLVDPKAKMSKLALDDVRKLSSIQLQKLSVCSAYGS